MQIANYYFKNAQSILSDAQPLCIAALKSTTRARANFRKRKISRLGLQNTNKSSNKLARKQHETYNHTVNRSLHAYMDNSMKH